MTIDQRNSNAVIQALCARGLQGKAQEIFVTSSLPDVDTDKVQRMIADFQCSLKSFSRDIAEIEEKYKEVSNERENSQS